MTHVASTIAPRRVKSIHGYVLPSVLFILTLLSFIAAAVLSLQYFQRTTAVADVASLNAQHAAESGAALALSEVSFASDLGGLLGRTPLDFSLQDGARAQLAISPWGLFLLAQSEGFFRRACVRRTALVAEHSSDLFSSALVFANSLQQLVLTGNAQISGNVITRKSGAIIGTMPGQHTPLSIPVSGTIRRDEAPNIPPLQLDLLQAEISRLRALLESPATSPRGLVLSSTEGITIDAHTVPDSVAQVLVRGKAKIIGPIVRRDIPLRLAVLGDLELAPETGLLGLVSIMGNKQVRIGTIFSSKTKFFGNLQGSQPWTSKRFTQ
jgi:hypothetical protein